MLRERGNANRPASIFERGEDDGAHFKFRAFALQAQVAGVEGAFGDFVQEFAVDEGLHFAVQADDFAFVPFAHGFLGGGRGEVATEGDGGVGIFALVLFGFGTGHEKDVTLPRVFALHLHALRPDLVGRLDVDEDAAVVGLGRDFDEAPFDGEKIIAANLRGAEVAGGLAGAMDEAIRDAPRLRGVGVVFHGEGEAGEIFAVEQGHGHLADAGGGIIALAILGGGIFQKYGGEANEEGAQFHPRRLGRAIFFGKRIQDVFASNSASQIL